jgi:hypothetical protein
MAEKPRVDERGRRDCDRNGHQASGRITPAREERQGEREDGEDVEPQRPLLAALTVHIHGGVREPGGEPGDDQRVEPVPARQAPEMVRHHEAGSVARSR